MNILKRLGFIGIAIAVCAVLSALISFLSLEFLFHERNFMLFLTSFIFNFIVLMLIINISISHRFCEGKFQEILFFLSITLLISMLFGFLVYCFVKAQFNLTRLDWLGFIKQVLKADLVYYGITLLSWILFMVFYCTILDRRFLDVVLASGIHGSGGLNQIVSNLENSRWMNAEEKKKLFKSYKYSQLANTKKDGIPVSAELNKRGTDMEVAFQSPCHALVIGSTGSGKTTTFVSPMIQLIGATAAGSSMIVTDPKGELFGLHSKFLNARGYDVKVIDLRDTYSSYRWNPLDAIWDSYTNYRLAHKMVHIKKGNPEEFGLKAPGGASRYTALEKWYEFDGKAYTDYDSLITAVKLYRKKIFDEVYEDLNDLISVLIPVENEKDPMWEKGARSITLAVVLAMLEDSEDENLHLTKEKFNFFNMAKILQNSTNDYEALRGYFNGRSPLSKAKSLCKQVVDAATQTRASYMSIVYEKLTMFNDAGICALTSASDFSSEQLAYKPTALFLKIPDEKDTRHNLAAIFILNIYKTLIKVASAKEDLTLDRNVYFIMDEFGNMPKIEKFDKFITVGRSRKIWFTMIIQSYAQLNNVYGDTVADIVKGNCGIKMFIGSNDMNTCKEYSELCGNITVVTQSSSSSIHSTDINYSSQTQVRPLIYPSELQRLNAPGDIGHSIIVTFGNYPLKTYFTPSFKVSLYKMGKMDTGELTERFFDENEVYYDIAIRAEMLEKAADQVDEEQEDQETQENNTSYEDTSNQDDNSVDNEDDEIEDFTSEDFNIDDMLENNSDENDEENK